MLRRVAIVGLVAVASLLPTGAGAQYYPLPPRPYAPPVQRYAPVGCVYYEHRDFQGASFSVQGSTASNYIGDQWNDRISSIACSPGCSVTVWEHANYGGQAWRVGGSVPWVGQYWNDRISAFDQRC